MKLDPNIMDMLTQGQQEALRTALSGRNVFISGGAGTGKSLVTQLIILSLRSRGRNVMVCAPTGVAATLAGGSTIHKAFGLPSVACINEKKMSVKAHAPQELCITDTVIIDEISMCRMDVFDAVAASIRKAEAKKGRAIQLIVVGDFFQLPPILDNKYGVRKLLETYYGRKISTPFAFLGESWKACRFIPVILTETKRQNDAEFIRNLNLARVGDVSCLSYFNDMAARNKFTDAVNLYSVNKDVDIENWERMRLLSGDEVRFSTVFDPSLTSKDTADCVTDLYLKLGARVIITQNDTFRTNVDDVSQWSELFPRRADMRFHNGSLGTVVSLHQDPSAPEQDYVAVKVDGGDTIMFYRQRYSVYRYEADGKALKRVVLGTYTQVPLRPAYAMTIHRGQGQTYDRANIDPACRNSGQLYVALSRLSDIHGLFLTHKIQPWNLIVDKTVIDFYDHLSDQSEDEEQRPGQDMDAEELPQGAPAEAVTEPGPSDEETPDGREERPERPVRRLKKDRPKGIAPSPKGGRPSRFPGGSTTLRVPNQIAQPMQEVIDALYPKLGDGRLDTERIDRLVAFLEELVKE